MLQIWDLAGGPGAERAWKFKVNGLGRGPLATSKQIAGRSENRKTEIRTPQYEDKIGNSRMVQNGKKTRLATPSRTAVCPEGPADSFEMCSNILSRIIQIGSILGPLFNDATYLLPRT